MKKHISGIYRIINLINGKMYIGSSKNIKRRLGEHFRKLKKGNHHNAHLQNAYKKYGHSFFKTEILLLCSEKNLLKKERAYILSFKSIEREFGYNLELPNTRVYKKQSNNRIKKLKEFYKSNKPKNVNCSKQEWIAMTNSGYKHHKGKWVKKKKRKTRTKINSKEILKSDDIIVKLTKEGVYINEFLTYKEAAESVRNGRVSYIRKVVGYYDGDKNNRIYISHQGFIWVRRCIWMSM